jgi:hypothetical protein
MFLKSVSVLRPIIVTKLIMDLYDDICLCQLFFILVLLTRMGIQFQTTVRAFLQVVKFERFRHMRWGIDKVKKSVLNRVYCNCITAPFEFQ